MESLFLFQEEKENLEKKNTFHYEKENFSFPIEYIENKIELDNAVIGDLELIQSMDKATPSIYEIVFEPKCNFSKQIIPFCRYYTTDVDFLQDSQHVIENMKYFEESKIDSAKIEEQWYDIKFNKNFIEKYGYLDWEMFKEYNKNSIVLQSISFTNMISPLLSLIIPIILLIIPFVLLRLQGIPITFSIYFKILKDIAKNHFIGAALRTMETFSLSAFIYFIGMIGLYGFQMYQNINQCMRFYRNTQHINTHLCSWKEFVKKSRINIKSFLQHNKYESYKKFNDNLIENEKVLEKINTLLEPICPFSCSIMKTTEIGYMLKCYYELYSCPKICETIQFSMGFEGYLNMLANIKNRLDEGILNKCDFIEDKKIVVEIDISGNKVKEEKIINDSEICEQYYPLHLKEEKCVKNSVNLNNYGVITGPNASGKTTFLKSTAINIIISQQFGVGFYKSCKLCPYKHIYSYLNIPDTSARDSLFQAESRRCKEILDSVKKNQTRHFCIFDELYSGTNPTEATHAAQAFIEYLRKFNNIQLFLTTHYTSMCEKWDTNASLQKIKNYRMRVIENDKNNTPTYTIEPGISNIEGALNILIKMEYPQEILNKITNYRDINV